MNVVFEVIKMGIVCRGCNAGVRYVIRTSNMKKDSTGLLTKPYFEINQLMRLPKKRKCTTKLIALYENCVRFLGM